MALLLTPIGAVYGATTSLRHSIAKPYRPKARVLCVGNLTAGGSGKTPVALALGRMLIARGASVFFLTRGYGGRIGGPLRLDETNMSAAGDEAPLLAAVAPTVVASDRAAGARRADADGADVIIMDDGFQNFALAKDLSILVVDGETGFGNGRLIPAGPLRERVSDGLARADAVVCMGDGILPIPRGFLGPSLRARLLPKSESLKGRPVLAFAGIGRPEKFFRTLHEMDAVLRGQRTFADHHTYSAAELKSLRAEAANLGAALVTTEKDWTRIPSEERAGILAVPVEAIFENPAAAVSLLDRLWPKPEEPRR